MRCSLRRADRVALAAICVALVSLLILIAASYVHLEAAEPMADYFRYPLEGQWTVSRGFANSFIGSWCGFHLADDVPQDSGASVYAAARGTVRFAEAITSKTKSCCGYVIVIEHLLPDASRVASVYYHLRRPQDGGIQWKFGDQVDPQVVLGYVSGRYEDHGSLPHLHFGIRNGPFTRGVDPRTGRWFYPGYTTIYNKGVRECDEFDPVHLEIVSEWEDPEAFIRAHLQHCSGPADCDDHDPCTIDACTPGGCDHNTPSPTTTLCGDSSSSACDDPNSCDGLGHCQANPRPADTPCTVDVNVCTDDLCDGTGACVPVNNTASCSDGNACTVGDTCSGGACFPGTPRNCDDADSCTLDSCTPATGCTHAPDPACAVCAGAAFCDTFSRPDSTVVGNGWSEVELAPSDARVMGGRLNFPGVDAAVSNRPHEGGAGGNNITMTWVYRKGSESVNLNEVDGVSAHYGGGRGIGGLFLVWIPRATGQVSIGDGQVLSTTPFSFALDTDYNFEWDIYPDYSMNVWIWRAADPKPGSPLMTISAFSPASRQPFWAIGNRLSSYFDNFRVETPARPRTIFFDDFNRPDSATVGNGWSEVELSQVDAQLVNSRLNFPTNDGALVYRPYPGGAGGNNVTLTWVYRNTGAFQVEDGVSVRWKPEYNAGRYIVRGLNARISVANNLIELRDDDNIAAPVKAVTHTFPFELNTDYNFQWDIYADHGMNLWAWRTADARPSPPTLAVAPFTPVSNGTYWAIGNRGGSFFDDFRVESPARPRGSGVSTASAWAREYEAGDEGGGDIRQAPDGGFIAGGWTKTSNIGGTGWSDMWLLKLDASGNVISQVAYGGASREEIARLVPTADGGYAALGLSGSFGASQHAPLVLKFDSAVTMPQWQKTYVTSGRDWGNDIQQTSDGGYVLAGMTDPCSCGAPTVATVMKLNSNGDVSWMNSYGGPQSGAGSIRQTLDGGYIVLGSGYGLGAGGLDLFLLKLDSLGVPQWEKTYGGAGDDSPADIETTTDGGYVVTGGTTSFGVAGTNLWVLKLKGDGTIDWQTAYGGNGQAGGSHIQQTADGGYVVAGGTTSLGAPGGDLWILRLDSNGQPIYQRTYDSGGATDGATAIRQTSDGGFITLSGSDPGCPLCNPAATPANLLVVKTKSDLNVSSSCTSNEGAITATSVIHTTAIPNVVSPTAQSMSVTAIDASVVVVPTSASTNNVCQSP